MLLYHGGVNRITKPDISLGRVHVDFGKGFYVTTHEQQAMEWATRIGARDENRKAALYPTISVFQFIESPELSIKHFNGYSEEWLRFVVENRRVDIPQITSEYDVVFGNIADDKVVEEVNRFIRLLVEDRATKIAIDYTLEQLSYQKENDQYCFKTESSLSELNFINSYEVKNG